MDDLYTVDTPENIEFAYAIAGIGSRFVAAVVDSVLIVALLTLLGIVFGVIADAVDLLDSLLAAIGGLLSFAVFWGYYITFEMLWNGQSPGKRMAGLRVVRQGGRPITFVSSAIRNVIRIIDFLPLMYGIGVVAMFLDRHARRLGDLAAGTLVVRDRQAVTLESLTGQRAPTLLRSPVPASADGQLVNLHLLNDQDYTLVQEFLQQRAELGSEVRRRLAAQLTSGLQARTGLPQDMTNPEQFLERFVAEYGLLREETRAVASMPAPAPADPARPPEAV